MGVSVCVLKSYKWVFFTYRTTSKGIFIHLRLHCADVLWGTSETSLPFSCCTLNLTSRGFVAALFRNKIVQRNQKKSNVSEWFIPKTALNEVNSINSLSSIDKCASSVLLWELQLNTFSKSYFSQAFFFLFYGAPLLQVLVQNY